MKNKTNEFFLDLLPKAFYHCEEETIIGGLLTEGHKFVYELLMCFFKKKQTEFPYKEEDIEVCGDCTTYDNVIILKIELKSMEHVKKVYTLFTLEGEMIHSKRYYATVESDGQMYCGSIDEAEQYSVCLNGVCSEVEEMQYIVEDYFDYWDE